jgi:hypothetical protein
MTTSTATPRMSSSVLFDPLADEPPPPALGAGVAAGAEAAVEGAGLGTADASVRSVYPIGP